MISRPVAALATGTGVLAAIYALSSRRFPESEQALATLRAPVSSLARRLLQNCLSAGIPLVVATAFRSTATQAALYAQGRTAPGSIVTNAPPGSSYHEYGLAFDLAVLKDGVATWPADKALWYKIGAIGEKLGLTWGGRFPGLDDYGHFELRLPNEGPGKSRPLSKPAGTALPASGFGDLLAGAAAIGSATWVYLNGFPDLDRL